MALSMGLSGYSDTQNIKFAYSLGGDMVYKLSGYYSIKASAEYFHTAPSTMWNLDCKMIAFYLQLKEILTLALFIQQLA